MATLARETGNSSRPHDSLAPRRILVDITHPAHLHFFRHAIGELRSAGHELLLTARDKDCLRELAGQWGMELLWFGETPAGWLGKGRTLLHRQWRLWRVVREFRPHVMAAIGGTFIGAVGYLTRVPTIVFTDTESATLSNWITFPFATRICVPRAFRGERRRPHLRYDGFHELAYLRPPRFQPDPSVLREMGVANGEPYTMVRFVGWRAGHDVGRRGLTREQKIAAVERLAEHSRVFITSEAELPSSLAAYRLPLPACRMHDALAFASLLFGESSTMSSEAAILGVPSVFVYPQVELGIVQEHAERWRIVHWYPPEQFTAALEKASSLLRERRGDHWRGVARQIVDSSVDVSEFIREQVLESARSRAA